MAKNKNTDTPEKPQEAAQGSESLQQASTPNAAKYTREELAAASTSIFGQQTTPECVIAALRLAKCESATLDEARKIVEKFMKKEVN